ncbi:DUF3696 domain-containing protein [Polaromonas sp. UC242_47]|uniref:DUF3696 domain-containing protein n=1 Tax=Polaromonas sp. UC242_47 TaxID=3374626 RepID=UPI003788A405
MAHLAGMGVKRLRSLYEIDPAIELRPLTVLLGKNSAGKSTFARLFPLLRQSSERRKRSPVLWFGDLVDFGSFTQAVTRGENTLELTFALKFSEKETERRLRQTIGENRFSFFRSSANTVRLSKATITITLSHDSVSDSAYASRLKLNFHDLDVILDIAPDTNEISKILIDGVEFRAADTINRVAANQGSITPRLLFFRRDTEDKEKWLVARNPWRSALMRLIGAQLRSNTSPQTILRIASQLAVSTKSELLATMSKIHGPQAWLNLRNSLSENHPFVKDIQRSLVASNIESIIEVVDEGLGEIFEGVRYLKPLRATAERYYRRLDLAVAEIDPEGRNFPMFLDSLSPNELSSFQAWTKKYLELDVSPQKEGAQLMVMAKGIRDTAMSNIADMGFGISQVLPIAAQLWSSSNQQNTGSRTSFVVVEQPELHLHPQYQAKLGDVFAGFIRPNEEIGPTLARQENAPRLIIETHSQHLINRLGALVESGQLLPSDVSIVLFEPDPEKAERTRTRVSGFDERGVLTNWPYGFFDPES